MKPINIIILTIYFCLLVAGSIVFCLFYYPRIIDPVNSGQRPNTSQATQTVFFTSANQLYLFSASNNLERLGAEPLQTLVQNIDSPVIAIDQTNLYFEDAKTIKQLELGNRQLKTIMAQNQAGLSGFDHFNQPVISPAKTKFVIKATKSNATYLLLYEKQDSKVTNLLAKTSWDEIYDYLWLDEQTLVFSGKDNEQFAIMSLSLRNLELTPLLIGKEKMDKLALANKNIFFLKTDQTKQNTDLFSLSMDKKTERAITTVGQGSKVINFDLNDNGSQIVFETQTGNDSNLNLSKANGSSLIQLTKDNQSHNPVFLNNSDEFIYWVEADGFYKSNSAYHQPIKILSYNQKVDQITVWR